jgi:hypothetical protein
MPAQYRNHRTLVVGTHNDNKKAGIPTTTGIPAPIQADYRGNFGLGRAPIGRVAPF